MTRSNFLGYLKTPYPFYYSSTKSIVLILVVISLLSFSFSYVFEPFEINRSEHKIDYVWICLIHAMVPLLIGVIYFSLIKYTVKEETKWTLGKEGFYIGCYLFLVGVGSFLSRDLIYDNPDNWSFRYFFEEIRNTFLVGVLLLMILLPLNLERLLSKYKKKAKSIQLDNQKEVEETIVTIKTPLKSEYFELKLSDFVCAKVDGNYTDVYLKNAMGINSRMVRISLKMLEEQLAKYSFIVKTHRSFLVNISYINAVSGNAQGYELSLAGLQDKIPVSRANISLFDKTVIDNS